MMKRRISAICVCLCIMFMAGCNNQVKSETDIKNSISTQKTQIAPNRIVSTYCGVSCYEDEYPDNASLAAASSQIIYGEILDMEYKVRENGVCSTILNVQVLQSVKGDYQEGEIINIAMDQGIASLQDYLNSFDDNDDLKTQLREIYSNYSDAELGEYYIQQVEQGDVLPEVEQTNLYFLRESAYYDEEKTYCRLNGPQGSYTEIADDEFVRTQTLGNQQSYAYEVSRQSAVLDNGETFLTYSLNNLIEQMNL